MFCYQCQETSANKGCGFKMGVCGKKADTAELMDLLIYSLKGVSLLAEKGADDKTVLRETGRLIINSLFPTITNANFDSSRIYELIRKSLEYRDSIKARLKPDSSVAHDSVNFTVCCETSALEKALKTGVMSTENEDVRSLRELLVYGIKGISAYAVHAAHLGFEDDGIYEFVIKGLASTTKTLPIDEMIGLVLKAGETAVSTMALLDKANTTTYGNPEITKVNIGVGKNPGILVSGHDLKDMEALLEQTQGSGVDIYTHSEMLPAHYYPAFRKYRHFFGNYGSAWWKQQEEFESFNGPILMTTNCLVPVKDSYKDRVFTTGPVGYPGLRHIEEINGRKDFSELISLAKKSLPPKEIEKGEIIGGFAHNQVIALADKVVAAVKSGAIKRFVVMAGCDGRHKTRSYFTEVAEALPKDTIILTAGCAKYRYNKLPLGDIGGIPRVLDAGQCNDSYSLAVIALKLKEVFGLDDVNKLPLSFDIAWYEQKAVAVLLALLYLGFKGIRLGPTLPAFLSPNVAKVLVDKFGIKLVTEAKSDVAAMMQGE